MIVERIICVVLGVLLVVGIAAGASDLTPSTISNSNTGWLIANNGLDQTTITVYAIESSEGPVSNTWVDFSLDAASTGLGTISPVTVKTDANGMATAKFNTSTRSGNATILATFSYKGTSKTLRTFQRVNHNIPQYASFNYPATATVGTVTQINITLTDKYNNPIDNKNPADVHPIVLDASSSGGAGFQNGTSYGDHIVLQTDAAGTASINFRLSTIAGINYFMLQPVGNINEPPLSITGIGESMPVYLSQTYPSPPYLPADGASDHYFTIEYTITDKYGNSVNTSLLFSADDGTSSMKVTNPFTGKIRAYFGPKDTSGYYTLTAATPANASIFCLDTHKIGSCTQTVQFFNTTPVDMTLMANPQAMASFDADSTSKASIQARVMDEKGNPANGELVRFSNATPTYPGGPYKETTPLHLSATSATVSNGYASIVFTPGAFTTNSSDPLYKSNATGQVDVIATWKNPSGVDIKRNVTLMWKNYPYLSISSEGNCTDKRVGDTINVTIVVAGDGAALRPKPIDVILVIDKSGSMGSGSGSRMAAAQAAAISFVNNSHLTEGTDRIGVISYSYENTVTRDADLGTPFSTVRTKINAIASGGGTGTREGFKQAIDHMIASGRPGAVRAIILMTDGNWNNGGSPLAVGKGYDLNTWVRDNREYGYASTYYGFSGYATDFEDVDYRWYSGLGGALSSSSKTVVKTPRHIDATTGADVLPARTTETRGTSGSYSADGQFTHQNMSIYAKDNNIRLYTLTFAQTVAPDEIKAMTTLANSTGGFYRNAPTQADLQNVYSQIAGELKTTAGGDTKVALDFGHVNINDNPLDTNITQYMNYVYYHNSSLAGYKTSDSTYTNKTKLNDDGTITLQYEALQDDTTAWSNHKMDFNVGEIKLNESWSVNFRLNLTKAGKIELFGPQSASNIKFNDTSSNNATQTAFIPVIQCNILQKKAAGIGNYNLSVYDLKDGLGLTGTIPTQWPIEWNTTYDGNETAVEEIKYKNVNIPSRGWQLVDYGWAFKPAKTYGEKTYLTIPTTDDVKWPPGDQFCIQITATADDVNGAAMSNEWCRTKVGSGGTQYIKLE